MGFPNLFINHLLTVYKLYKFSTTYKHFWHCVGVKLMRGDGIAHCPLPPKVNSVVKIEVFLLICSLPKNCIIPPPINCFRDTLDSIRCFVPKLFLQILNSCESSLTHELIRVYTNCIYCISTFARTKNILI